MNLFFSEVPSPSGFTTATLTSTNDKEASKIIKEIIQNSFDSAIEKGVCAEVKFLLQKIPLKDIPFINEYLKALERIEKEELSEQEKDILNEIKEYLKNEQIDVLYVIDNGKGFEKKNLIAMLGDGISVKQEGSGGSYGNGHFSIFNISALRYLLYFGKNSEGEIFSGHTILRTFEEDGTLKDKNGYVLKIQKPILEKYDLFETNTPEILKDKLVFIKDTGAIIGILGFNFFLNEENWVDLIKASVVRNFFVAIERGRLKVEIIENKTHVIDQESLDVVFEETKEVKIVPKYDEVRRFYVLLDRQKHICKTPFGEVEIYFGYSDITKLAICRNGMYITSMLPSPLRKENFVGYKPFNALIIPESLEISNLIKRAEGPLHDDINMKRFSDDKSGKEKKGKLREVFRAINEFIKSKIEKLDEESFTYSIPEFNIATLIDKHDKKGKKKANKISKKREPVVIGSEEKSEIPPTPKKTSSKSKLRIGKEVPILKKFISFNDIQTSKLYLKLQSEYKDLYVRIKVDDGTDLTCDTKSVGLDLEIIDVKGKNAQIMDKMILITDIKDEMELEIEYKSELKGVVNYQFFKAIP